MECEPAVRVEVVKVDCALPFSGFVPSVVAPSRKVIAAGGDEGVAADAGDGRGEGDRLSGGGGDSLEEVSDVVVAVLVETLTTWVSAVEVEPA